MTDVAEGAFKYNFFNILHMLRYGLMLNHLTDDPSDYMGVVTDNETIDVSGIVKKMIGKGSTVTTAEALSVIEEFEYAIVEEVKNGNNVRTNLFKIYASVSGVFNSEEDSFDASRHAVRLNLSAGSRLAEAIEDIELKKVAITSPQPVIQRFMDLKSKVINESFAPGRIASIRGLLLKFDEEDIQQGIFFIASDGSETRVDEIAKNMPSELLFFVPETLRIGSYQVEVRTKFHKSKTLKKTRLLHDLVSTS
jgi:hypothetical protein